MLVPVSVIILLILRHNRLAGGDCLEFILRQHRGIRLCLSRLVLRSHPCLFPNHPAGTLTRAAPTPRPIHALLCGPTPQARSAVILLAMIPADKVKTKVPTPNSGVAKRCMANIKHEIVRLLKCSCHSQICDTLLFCCFNTEHAPVSQLVEEAASKSAQCGFESHRGHLNNPPPSAGFSFLAVSSFFMPGPPSHTNCLRKSPAQRHQFVYPTNRARKTRSQRHQFVRL